MGLNQTSRDDILFLEIEDQRLLDEQRIEQLEKEILAALDATTESRAVMDFSRVQFMSSSALGKLVKIHKKCQGYKMKLKLSGLSKDILEVFKITRLDKLFDIEKDAEAARKAFNKKGFFG